MQSILEIFPETNASLKEQICDVLIESELVITQRIGPAVWVLRNTRRFPARGAKMDDEKT